mmetsp:Transcript_9635/g.14436  ORF Transcript_9635/g.14436 Transcript_9635/m.14436 type:complete len:416 (+) Transcript_9635:54-1301(+)
MNSQEVKEITEAKSAPQKPSTAKDETVNKAKKEESKKDFREGDWYCKICKAHNFASRSNCFRCMAPQDPPQNFKMGDWMCHMCGAHNYRSKRSCFRCRVGKPAMEVRNSMRPGDWICINCGAHNFKDKINCFSCFHRKPYMPMGQYHGMEMMHQFLPPNFKPGDWMCVQCGAHNYQSRSSCFRCSSEKSQIPQQGGAEDQLSSQVMIQPNIYHVQALLAQASLGPRLPTNFRPGDWMCASCGAHNYRSREECYKCNKKKPQEVYHGGASTASTESKMSLSTTSTKKEDQLKKEDQHKENHERNSPRIHQNIKSELHSGSKLVQQNHVHTQVRSLGMLQNHQFPLMGMIPSHQQIPIHHMMLNHGASTQVIGNQHVGMHPIPAPVHRGPGTVHFGSQYRQFESKAAVRFAEAENKG